MHNWPLVNGIHRLTMVSSKMASMTSQWYAEKWPPISSFEFLCRFVYWRPFYNIGINYKKFTIKLPRVFMYTQYAYGVDRMNASLCTGTSQCHGVSNLTYTYRLFIHQLVQAKHPRIHQRSALLTLCKGYSPMIVPSPWVSNAESVSMTWRPHMHWVQCMSYQPIYSYSWPMNP